jgi:hypothetical protein
MQLSVWAAFKVTVGFCVVTEPTNRPLMCASSTQYWQTGNHKIYRLRSETGTKHRRRVTTHDGSAVPERTINLKHTANHSIAHKSTANGSFLPVPATSAPPRPGRRGALQMVACQSVVV